MNWVICVAAFALHTAQAGTVEQATIVADPQMQVKDGAVQGCGYRLKAIPSSFDGLSSVVILDTSFNFYSTGLGLLKGGALAFQAKGGTLGQATTKQIESFWLKTATGRPTTPQRKVIPAENKGYLLYSESIDTILNLFASVAEGVPITVGVRIKGESVDRIYTGRVNLSDQDKAQGDQCIEDLMKQLEADPVPKPAGR